MAVVFAAAVPPVGTAAKDQVSAWLNFEAAREKLAASAKRNDWTV
jgi:hypothetical protein